METMLTTAQRLALAREHHQAGRVEEAEALYRSVLAETPQDARVLHALGLLTHQAGRNDEALGLIAQALVAGGPNPVVYSNLAAISIALGQLGEAENYCQAALALKADLVSAHYHRGVAAFRDGRLLDAERAFREAVRCDPRLADARRRLERQPPELLGAVIAQLRALVDASPDSPDGRRDLGLALYTAVQPARAVEQLRIANRLRPGVAATLLLQGQAHQQNNENDEAIACFREAVRLEPEQNKARYLLANSLLFRGDPADARAELLAILAQDPGNAQAVAVLSKLVVDGGHEFSADEVSRIAELAARPGLDSDPACRLHFSLAQLLDHAGQCDAAFAHAEKANALRCAMDRARGAVFDPDEHHRLVDRLIAVFTPGYFERVRSFGIPSALPVFVVGMMRSGTTLAEQILASHLQVHGANELRDMSLLSSTLPARLGTPLAYPECANLLDAAVTHRLAEQHLRMLCERGGGAIRVVDKFPLNFLHLGVIATLFPRAQIVHCRRHPLDTCISCYLLNLAGPFPFKNDLSHFAAYYRDYERLMAHWRTVLPTPMLELHYEELTADPEPVSRRLVAHCGLDWDERCLRFHETERPVRTASMLQVRRPIYRSAVGRWRRYAKQLQPVIEALGLKDA
jgi:tetratricopeptide (TPR) repeat protein